MSPSEKPAKFETGALEAIPFRNPQSAAERLSQFAGALTPGIANALPGLLADCPDPDSALLLLERLVAAAPEMPRIFQSHPFLAHYSVAVFGHSRYLGETLVQNPDLLQTFLREKKLDRSFSHEEFSEALARFRSRSFERDVSLLLARFKRR